MILDLPVGQIAHLCISFRRQFLEKEAVLGGAEDNQRHHRSLVASVYIVDSRREKFYLSASCDAVPVASLEEVVLTSTGTERQLRYKVCHEVSASGELHYSSRCA